MSLTPGVRYGIALRASSGYVTDPTNIAFANGTVYPVSGVAFAGGTTVCPDHGWSVDRTAGDSDKSTTYPRTAGQVFVNSATTYFRIDLPNGNYKLWLAIGDITSTTSNSFMVRDGTGTAFVDQAASVSVASGSVMEIDSSIQTRANFETTQVELDVTVTQGFITIKAGSSYSQWRLSHIGFMLVDLTPLGAAVLTDDLGDPDADPKAVWTLQPEGTRAFKVTCPAGAVTTSSIALTGDLASYFDVVDDGGDLWLVHNATPLPDALAGSRSLSVVQTDAGYGGSPYTTDFTCNVISSEGRNTTGWQGRITTQNWLNRQLVADTVADIWTGYDGETIANNFIVTDNTSFSSALSSINTDGRTGWDRIQVQDGTYSGIYSFSRSYGTGGGLLIEPYPGHDPDFNVSFANGNLSVHGIHVRNLRMSGSQQYYIWRFIDPGPTGINGTGRFNKIAFTGNRIGKGHVTGGSTDADIIAGFGPVCVGVGHGESVYFHGNICDGSGNPIATNGVRKLVITENDLQRGLADCIAINNAQDYDSTQGVFADDKCYTWIVGNTLRNELRDTAYSNGIHPDFIQVRAFGTNALWDPGEAYSVGAKTLNMLAPTPAVYECTTAGTTEASGTGPMRSTQGETGIVDGTVVWTHLADYTTASEMHVVVEDNDLNNATDGNTTGYGSTRSLFIDSNSNRNCPVHLSFNNNAVGFIGAYGIQIGDGFAHVEYNTFAKPSGMSAGSGPAVQLLRALGADGNVRARYNVYEFAATAIAPNVPSDYGNVVIDWDSATDPGTVLEGTFTRDQGPSGNWWGYALTDDGSNTTAEFRTAFRTILQATDTTVGIQADDPTPPVVATPISDQSNDESDVVSLDVSGNFTGATSYSATGLPTGLSINSGTGVISGTISEGASASSPFSSEVTATNADGSIADSFSWTVSAPAAGTVYRGSMGLGLGHMGL